MTRQLVVLIVSLVFVLLPAGALAENPTPAPPGMPPDQGAWVIIRDLGPDATQAEYGAEVYRLVCKACHGDKGQGLTPDWLAQWAPEDQNCWQMKCHAANHPPDGFELPRDIPPVVGTQVAARFPSALQLQSYVAATMPWHAPGALSADEYWQVTAYLLEINGVDAGKQPLNQERAAQLRLGSTGQGAPTPGFALTPALGTSHPPGTAATRQAEIAADRAAEQAAHGGWPWGWGILLLGSMTGLAWVADQWMRQI